MIKYPHNTEIDYSPNSYNPNTNTTPRKMPFKPSPINFYKQPFNEAKT